MSVTLRPRAVHKTYLTESQHWELKHLPDLLTGRSGICALRATLDTASGPEIVLAIFDHTPFVVDLAQLRPFEFHLKAGLVRTDSGPLMWLLFWLRSPHGSEPYAMWDVTLNPHNEVHLDKYWELAHQSHWHVFILGLGDEVLNMYQIENEFQLAEALSFAVEASAPIPCTDFDAAEVEYQDTYTLRELLATD